MKTATKSRLGYQRVMILIIVPFIVLFLALVTTFFLLQRSYAKWERAFESGIERDNHIVMSEDNDEISKSIDNKVSKYSLSSEEVDFVIFTPREFLYILSQGIGHALPNGVSLQRSYIFSKDREADLYFQFSFKDLRLPWLRITLRKDNLESAEIFAEKAYIGGLDFDTVGLGRFLDDINDGYRDALIFINENQITGRDFQNVEIEKEAIIFKGQLARK